VSTLGPLFASDNRPAAFSNCLSPVFVLVFGNVAADLFDAVGEADSPSSLGELPEVEGGVNGFKSWLSMRSKR
jgi:hypothetical protein